ncbi:MAG: NAD(P)/FAD-dependent oxidoreductase [Bacteroidetes bacterium]|nr:NAD(P)/FAD-dependent oxidoreductase [Bacteroidota bacterium]
MREQEIYDFVIIGSGLGGLECAYILASEGHKVIVLEKNHKIGGNLQVFSRDKCAFDTGVHYIGSLDEGECLNQFFKYFGLLDTLKWKRMDDDCFDMIRFEDGKEYALGQGYERFERNLINDFPEEEDAIKTYCAKVQEICSKFPLYNLQNSVGGNYLKDEELLSLNAADYINSLTRNVRLRAVLAGNNPLYAGVKSKSPFYVHALISNSYIMGAYRLKDGGSQIATQMSKYIRQFGGTVLKRKKVIGANYNEDGHIIEVLIEGGETVKGKQFISNVHPAVSINIFGENRFRKAFRKRIKNLENTISTFIVHLVFEKNSFKQLNHNTYQYYSNNVWDGADYDDDSWPKNFFVSTPVTSSGDEYAESMSIMAYMKYDDVKQWGKVSNTVAKPNERGLEYEAFKELKAQVIINKLEGVYPGIKSKIKSVHTSTPLTFRDYIGDNEGSLYGILKDSNSPLKSLINSKTKVPNLYFTGQNLIFHGILGATIGAFVTCFNFIDRETLMKKVNAFK